MSDVYINLKEYKYCVPKKLEVLGKDLVSIEELIDVIDAYEEELEFVLDQYKQLEYEVQEYYIPRKIDMENGELIWELKNLTNW